MNNKNQNRKCSKTQIEGRYALYSGGDCICTFEKFPEAEKAFYEELDNNPTSYVSLFSADHKTNYLSYSPINGETTRANIPFSVPERIWMTDDLVSQFDDKDFMGEDSVEYIMKDAFIEKACEYFRRSLEDTKIIDEYRNILVRGIQASYTSVEEFIDDFKNYMKRE